VRNSSPLFLQSLVAQLSSQYRPSSPYSLPTKHSLPATFTTNRLHSRQFSPGCQHLPPNASMKHLVFLLWVAILCAHQAVAVKSTYCAIVVKGQGQPELHSDTVNLCVAAGCRCLLTSQRRCGQFVREGNTRQIWSHPLSPSQCRACKCRRIEEGSNDDRGDRRKVDRFGKFRRVKKIKGTAGGMKPAELFESWDFN
jgi:hypothetical protein